jgi:tetratricopeptide (TPR) repeat protein
MGHPQSAGPLPVSGPGLAEPRLDGEPRQEVAVAREVRARDIVAGHPPARITADIHDECAPEFGTTWIRAHRLALGIALGDVVAQVKAWYAREGRPEPRFSETLLSAYESGQKRPGPEYLHYLSAVYRADPPDLGFPGPCFCGQSHRDGCAVRPARAADVTSADTWPQPAIAVPAPRQGWPGDPRDGEAEDDDDVLRRMLLRLIADPGSQVTGSFFGTADRIRRRMDDALVSGTVSATMLDQWEESTAAYGRQYGTAPPLRLLCDLLLDFGDVRRMSERRQPLDYSERLCRLAAQQAGLAGLIMIDVGDARLARSFFRTARNAADETADRRLRAWVTAREALVPLYYGDPAEAAALARAASDLAGRNPCVAGVMAPVIEARSMARQASAHREPLQQRAQVRVTSLLSRAHDELIRLPAADRADTAFGYTERQFLFHEGDTLIAMHNHQRAQKALGRALQLYPPAEVLDRSLVTLGVARCLLDANEPEEALRLSANTLAGLPREHRSEIVVHTARSLGESAAGRHGDVPAVREYREALLTA